MVEGGLMLVDDDGIEHIPIKLSASSSSSSSSTSKGTERHRKAPDRDWLEGVEAS